MTAVLPTARATTGPPVEGLASAAAACRPAEAAASSTGIGSQHALLSMSAASVGVISYGASLVMAHLLPAGGYTAFAAVVAMLATVGIAAGALVPLPLAAAVRSHPAGSPERRAAVSFAVTVSLLAGSATAGVLAAVASTFARPAVVITAAAAGFAVFVIAPVWGVLQGEGRFAAYAAGAMGQVVIRVVAGVAAVAAGWGVGGALAGFLVGAAVVLAMGVRAVGSDLTWRPSVLLHRARWAETGPIAAVQVALSALAGIDVVLVAALTDPAGQAGGATAAAGYQVVAALTKAPLYVAAGAVVVSYPLLRAADQATRDRMLRAALSSFARLVVPATAILATAPAAVTALVLPAHLAASASLLPWLAVAGLGYATLTIALLVLLGIGARFRCLAALGPVALLLIAGVWLGWSYGGIDGVAVGASSGAAIAAGGVLLLAAPSLPRWPRREVIRAVVAMTALAAALVLARTVPALWVVLVGLIALHILGRIVAPSGRRAPLRAARLQILHLGFEDPAMPGAGGGSVRTHEINRRLAADHDVTVLTTRYPGCRDRVQDGVRYLHVGIGAGRTHLGRVLGYILVLPFHTRRRAADLVVEDFFAPISTMAAPLWTRRPTIGVVQWLNARQKARQYRLPVHLVEQFGVRRHHSLIAMSHDLDDQLHALNPAAHVEVIGNGVEPAAFATTHTLGEDIVFIGRLETAQKGVDLLLRAWAIAAPRCEATLVIAGTGPDEARLQQLATDLGVADRVRFIGWVSGAAKHALLARARLVVVPSRFETFGMVAAEALAAATPVVAFDIPCLREIVPPTCGRRVPAFDTAALADAIVDLYPDTPWLLAAGAAGREFAARFNWDHLAFRQAGVYLAVASAATPITASTGEDLVSTDQLRAQLSGLGRTRTRGRRAPRVVVIGNVGNGNTGDEALLAVTLAALDPDACVTVLSRNPAQVTAVHGVTAAAMIPQAAARVLARCDGLVVVGGGMFGPGLPPLVRLLPHVLHAAAITGRETAYVGIGAYPGMPARTLAALRRSTARSRGVTVRDRASGLLLVPGSPPACIGDLGLHLEPASTGEARQALRDAGVDIERPLLLLAPKAGTSPEKTRQLVAASSVAARHWARRGGAVAALAFADHADHGIPAVDTDRALATRIARDAGIPIPRLGPNLHPALAKGITAQAAAVLALRFHGVVFAASTGVPASSFAWEPKTAAFLSEHTLPALGDPLHPTELTDWLDMCLSISETTRSPK